MKNNDFKVNAHHIKNGVMVGGSFCCWLSFAAFPIWILTFQKFQTGGKKNGIQQRTGEQEMAYFNSNRRFYHWTSDFGKYLEESAHPQSPCQ
mgnify:CR=1 FL=1